MKSLKIFGLALVAVLSVSMNFESSTRVCHGFLPENDMDIPVQKSSKYFGRNQRAGGLTEQEFNTVIDNIERLYKDQVRAAGGNLVINRLWEKGTVNAYADRSGNDWIVNMYGGLARTEKMTADAFAMVICHELGHHIGGAKKLPIIKTWGTNEGGSDYFASTKCIRKYFELDSNNREQLTGEKLSLLAVASCKTTFDNDADRLVCARSMLAGQALAYTLAGMNWFGLGSGKPQFSTPDTHQVMWTKTGHPEAQCRLDTFFHGALCTVDKNAELDDSDYHVGTCTALTHKEGLRPRCWFKPQE